MQAMGIDWNATSAKSNAGTELMCRGLEQRLDPELLAEFQIIPSRMENPLDPDRIRLLWCHDLAHDQMFYHLSHGGWEHFDRIVMVSNWQMGSFIDRYAIPWSRCVVMRNAIEPVPLKPRERGVCRLIYTSTPQRGLNILLSAFAKLREKYGTKVELDVFSSFKLYGRDADDEQFKPLFEQIDKTEGARWHGVRSNQEVREALMNAHVFAYPSIWRETSCLALMEAMSAGLICVHPNYGALFETAANWTAMYQWQEDPQAHARAFYNVLDLVVASELDGRVTAPLLAQKHYADLHFGWERRAREWEVLLRNLVGRRRARATAPTA
jgi:glycosyltransferase involved in cell wall biosynthesis